MIGISCRRAAELLSRSHEDSLGGVNRLALSAHLAICVNCRAYSRQLKWIERALERAFRDAPPGLEEVARRRIARVLGRVQGGGPTSAD